MAGRASVSIQRKGEQMIKLKIVSDGRPNGTRVIDAETGEELDWVTRVEWTHTCKDVSSAIIHVCEVAVEIDLARGGSDD